MEKNVINAKIIIKNVKDDTFLNGKKGTIVGFLDENEKEWVVVTLDENFNTSSKKIILHFSEINVI